MKPRAPVPLFEQTRQGKEQRGLGHLDFHANFHKRNNAYRSYASAYRGAALQRRSALLVKGPGEVETLALAARETDAVSAIGLIVVFLT